jgi:hypothetical protein
MVVPENQYSELPDWLLQPEPARLQVTSPPPVPNVPSEPHL